VTGFPAGVPTNRPLKGALVEVFALGGRGERLAGALLRKQISDDGLWGPLAVPAGTFLEFVIAGTRRLIFTWRRSRVCRTSLIFDRADQLVG
jgi:hypothetical protein